MSATLRRVFEGLPVLVTGHTGFKGSWLSVWLRELGAQVAGYSLAPPTDPSNFDLSRLGDRVTSLGGDVRNFDDLLGAMRRHRTRVVFHLAAQPIVTAAFEDPRGTFETNVMGTINVLEAARATGSVRAVVCVTTDKVYEDRGWVWGYRETDRLGGHEPYSASKAMTEIAIAAYHQSFFRGEEYRRHGVAVASARAGNVLGGGDFAPFRLLADCARALLRGTPVRLRHPDSIRPWQHLLDPLSGYLWLAAKLLDGGPAYGEAWNLGPSQAAWVSARAVVERCIALWGGGEWLAEGPGAQGLREVESLSLNSEKALRRLGWWSVCGWEGGVADLVDWLRVYQRQLSGGSTVDMYDVCVQQIARYTERATKMAVEWARDG